MRDAIAGAVTAPFRALRARPEESADDPDSELWALRDVSFDVRQGEVLGVIGRNGAGKSTLLKVLSRVTEPSAGHALVRGRVGSLLEVGTGFHPELTGRENVFLNGAVLGMSRAEIKRRFDEIVEFAEVGRFLDVPVKRYSSGMYMRLAFSVAAHLQPDVLIVDEVLAVGDLAFQRKCLGKMDEVARGGRTVLFVTHQMTAVRSLCSRCLWLEGGRVRMDDVAARVVAAYETAALARVDDPRSAARATTSAGQFVSWRVVHAAGDEPNAMVGDTPAIIEVTVVLKRRVEDGSHGIALWDGERRLMWAWSTSGLKLDAGVHHFRYNLPTLPLRPGAYSWELSLQDQGQLVDHWSAVPELLIATQPVADYRDEWVGVLNVPCEFEALPEAS